MRRLIALMAVVVGLSGCAPVSDQEVKDAYQEAAEQVLWSSSNIAKTLIQTNPQLTTVQALCMASIQTTLVDSWDAWNAMTKDEQLAVWKRMHRECPS